MRNKRRNKKKCGIKREIKKKCGIKRGIAEKNAEYAELKITPGTVPGTIKRKTHKQTTNDTAHTHDDNNNKLD